MIEFNSRESIPTCGSANFIPTKIPYQEDELQTLD
jgi:hypothetical protein